MYDSRGEKRKLSSAIQFYFPLIFAVEIMAVMKKLFWTLRSATVGVIQREIISLLWVDIEILMFHSFNKQNKGAHYVTIYNLHNQTLKIKLIELNIIYVVTELKFMKNLLRRGGNVSW